MREQIPEHAWYEGNPHYDRLWPVTQPNERLQREVFQSLLQALPEAAGKALIDCLAEAADGNQLKAMEVQALTKDIINTVVNALMSKAFLFSYQGHEMKAVSADDLETYLGMNS